MKKNAHLNTLLLCFFMCQTLYALAFSPPEKTPLLADITVSGKVMAGDTKESLVGVSIRIDGTDKGTLTDLDGNYSLICPSDATLVFSFIGYTDQKMPVNNQSVINITLVSSASDLNELIVIGYGSAVKSGNLRALN